MEKTVLLAASPPHRPPLVVSSGVNPGRQNAALFFLFLEESPGYPSHTRISWTLRWIGYGPMVVSDEAGSGMHPDAPLLTVLEAEFIETQSTDCGSMWILFESARQH